MTININAATTPASESYAPATTASISFLSKSFGFKAIAAEKIAAYEAEVRRRKDALDRATEIIHMIAEESRFGETEFYADCIGISSTQERKRALQQMLIIVVKFIETSKYLKGLGALEYFNVLEEDIKNKSTENYIRSFLNEKIMNDIENFTDEDIRQYVLEMALCAALHTEFESLKELEEAHVQRNGMSDIL